MKTGVILPTFRDTPEAAFDVARRARAAGVDGLFCYDHLWPMGQPERPALAPFPVLAAVLALLEEEGDDGAVVGTLVARIGLVPNAVLVNEFSALEHLAPGRVVAGLGTGDRLSEEENRAYGIPYRAAAERRAALVEVAQTLREAGVTVWVAGGLAARITEAQQVGAALNVWDAAPTVVAERVAGVEGNAPIEVTWGGPAPSDEDELRGSVRSLADAGATWAVYAWPVDLDVLASAAS